MSVTDTDLHIIDRPVLPPGHCIASFADEDPQGFIDTLITPPDIDPRIYISVTWVKTTAKKLGLVEPDGDAPADLLARENRALKVENEALNRQLDAIDVIESRGFQARKKAGRPKRATDES